MSEAPILSVSERAGLSILQIIKKCTYRSLGRPLKLAVNPEAWECILNFYTEYPMRLQEAKDGRTARIILFVHGVRVEVAADTRITEFSCPEWIDE